MYKNTTSGYKRRIIKLSILSVLFISSSFLFSQTTFTESASSFNLDVTAGDKDGGHAWGDYNNDGNMDIIINHDGLSLMRNNGNNTFTNVTNALVSTVFNNKERQASWGDINKDGRLDFLRSTSLGGLDIYIQNPNGTFGDGQGGDTPIRVRSSGAAEIIINNGIGLPSAGFGLNAEGAGFFDFEGDGDLDIFFDNHDFGIELLLNNTINHITRTQSSLPAATMFTHITTDANTAGGFSFGLNQNATDGDYGSSADINDDGWVDIFMRKRDENDFFLNQGGSFVNGSDIAQASNGNKGGNGLWDIDNDGDLDAVWTESGLNQIFRNDGTTGGVTTWSPLPTSIFPGLPQPSNQNGATSSAGIDAVVGGDIDNDGDIDILFVGDNRSYLFINLINDPVLGANIGSPMTFSLSSQTFNSGNNQDGEGTTMIDIDRDGDLDIYMNIRNGANQLWINNLSATNRERNIHILVTEDRGANGSTGGNPAAPAIGANIVIRDCAGNVISGLRQLGGAYGHGTQPSTIVHFGFPVDFVSQDLIIEVRYPNHYNSTTGTEDRLIASVLINPSNLPGDDNRITITTTDATSISNDAPIAVDDEATLCALNQVSVQLNLLANDTDPNNDNIFIVSVTSPTTGSVVIDNANTGLVTYTYSEATPFSGATFEYTISDINTSCQQLQQTDTATVTIITSQISTIATHIDESCSSTADGSITVTSSGGTAPYSYSLDNIDFSNTTGVFNGLSAGNYTIYVRDSNNCEDSSPIQIVISVTDTVNPLITAPDDYTIEGCDTSAITNLPFSLVSVGITLAQLQASPGGNGIASDNIDIDTITYIDVEAGTCPTEVTRLFTVTDACGNFSTDSQIITIEDTTNPTASNPLPINVECFSAIPAPDVTVVTNEADNCNGTPVVAMAML